jgi:hypothetical protein
MSIYFNISYYLFIYIYIFTCSIFFTKKTMIGLFFSYIFTTIKLMIKEKYKKQGG